jgi:hypothetical protein
VDIAEQLDEIEEEDTEDIEKKKELYEELQQSEAYQQEKLAYDIWTSAFYWPMDGSAEEYPSPSTIEKIRRNPNDEALEDLIERARNIAEKQRFFHWELEFPEVFEGQGSGFDSIIGNPPWEKPSLLQKEWFAGRNEEIASSDSKSERDDLIEELTETNPSLYEKYQKADLRADQLSKFLRESSRYKLSGRGDLNTYPIFTELVTEYLLDSSGHAGLVVKTGIATDYHTRHLFKHYIENNRLVSLFDFENTEGIFTDVERNERFCLITITGEKLDAGSAKFSFHNQSVDESRNQEKIYELTPNQFAQINPNTKSCPTFESRETRDIVVKLYERHPVLVNEEVDTNPWGIEYNRMYDMASDSGIFSDNKIESLQEKGYELTNSHIFEKEDERYLPLYEGKYISQFDHRFGTFEGVPKDNRFNRKAETRKLTAEEKKDVTVETIPRYWVPEDEFNERREDLGWNEGWIFAFRNVARSHTDFRTSIGTITPFYPHGHSAPVLMFDSDQPARTAVQFTTLFTSFTFDFALRQSIGGANFTLYILKQLPMPDPQTISKKTVNLQGKTEPLDEFLIQRGVDLLWTSHSLDPLGKTLKSRDKPITWDPEERLQWRAEIEAAVAKLYGINRNEFEYILDDFDILQEQEKEKYGYYRSKEEALEKFDSIELT